jgi:polyhydroxyalkanoate synthesis repressor PhaR
MSSEQQPAGAAAEEDRTARIVRYPNRRLYDRAQGRYVTLQEIVAMIREGKAVTVRDNKTGEDLTGTILTQILLEFHPERVDVFPVPVLHLLIRANDIVLAFLREYLRQSLTYLEFWQRAASFGSMAAPWEWLKSFMPSGPAQPAGAPSAPKIPTPAPPPPTGTEALARRVEELERRLSALGAPPEKGAAESPARKGRPAGRRSGPRSRTAPTPREKEAEQPGSA